ncbi:MAG: Smr/MutS family protein, partial [Treponema sp.]|nr:Smr/MutS family protein [Treponema sp.]
LAGETARLEPAAGGAAGGSLPIEPGAEVLAGPYGRRGRVLRQDRGSPAAWIVEIGSLKMSFSETELRALPPSREPPKPLIAAVDLTGDHRPQARLTLRGMRLDEALEALGKQIDAAVLGGLGEFAVIHGKGDGILQKGVHDFLKQQSQVADYYFSRPELGGFGRTEVILKRE